MATLKDLKALVSKLKEQEIRELKKVVKLDQEKLQRLSKQIKEAEQALAALDAQQAQIDARKAMVSRAEPERVAASRIAGTDLGDPFARVNLLEAQMKAAQADLDKIAQAEKRIAEIAADRGSTVASARAKTEELKAIQRDIGSLPKPQTVASATNEMRYADELAEELEKAGLRLKKKLPGVAEATMKKPRATTKTLRDALADELLEEARGMAAPMARFLGASLGEQFVEFADADYGIVYGSADDMVSKIIRNGTDMAGEYSGALSRFVLNQVDRTQDATPYRFTRHVEAKACSWCKSQVAVYETTRQFFRHANCRCMKVRS